MIRRATITIPQPCHEDWDKMTVAEKGRFCGGCQRHVYDFTHSSDREILKRFTEEPNLCGRFNETQLGRELLVPKEKSPLWIAAASGVLALMNPGHAAYAQQQTQTIAKVDQTENDIQPNNDEQVKISGVVSDVVGSLPGANIVIKGTTRGVQTDIDGKFELLVAKGEILQISFIGFGDQEITVGDKSNYDIILDSRGIELQGGSMLVRKRSIFGRFFVWTANLFRKEENRRSVKYY
jgi:hypothetical protein